MQIKPYERTAFYYETDQMGIIHHSNYIRWLEEARIDFMAKRGLSYDELERSGILIPVLGVSCDYRSSVVYNEAVIITVKVTSFTGIKFTAAYEITGKEDGRRKASASSKHCFVDRNWNPVKLKKMYPKIYEIFENALGEA